jgi:hypothetical protein
MVTSFVVGQAPWKVRCAILCKVVTGSAAMAVNKYCGQKKTCASAGPGDGVESGAGLDH